MSSWFLLVMHVLFMHLSQKQLLAFSAETGSVSVKCIEGERQALLALKQGLQLDKDWITSWGNGHNERECCNWKRVHCSNETGHVLKLDLHGELEIDTSDLLIWETYSSAVSISPSLANLHHLNYLDLSCTHFDLTKSIPNFIGSLTHLQHLNLSHCGFQGKIPDELGNLFSLEYLDLGDNSLDGDFPSQVLNLSHLVHLDLGGNSLEGKFSPQLGDLLSLKYLDLSHNSFTGTIPQHLGNPLSLKYLNLSNNEFTGTIPQHLGNLLSLKYLDLSDNSFIGTIPQHLGNLSSLHHLEISSFLVTEFGFEQSLRSDLQWTSHLSSIRHLSLPGVDLRSAKNWQQQVSGLSHLQVLDFSSCDLLDPPPSSLSSANFSTSLSFVDLSLNMLMSSSSIFPWLMNYTSSLATLRLSSNDLSGTIPEAFRNFSSLQDLELSYNHLDGKIPISLFRICSLSQLDLSYNRLTGRFDEFVRQFSSCAHKPMEFLNLEGNEIIGSVLHLSQLSSLQVLRLGNNGLNGTRHEGIGQLSNLKELKLQNNSLQGLITEAHFSGLSKLTDLDLSHNDALVLKISAEWVPPFDLSSINLSSCFLGPYFPRWLRSQKNFQLLDISGAGIFDTIPNWFWERPIVNTAVDLILSNNHIRGKIENLPLVRPISFGIDLSSNLFEGPVPAFLSMATKLDLSNNKFSTANLLLCANTTNYLSFLDLSHNHLSGELPKCSVNFQQLVFLDLSDNNFDVHLPNFLGSLRHIQSLHLDGNNFLGEIPLSLRNCAELKIFHAGRNNFSGPVPSWIGHNLQKLVVLSLHSNKFNGSMPFGICHLVELRLLDLSLNDISGNIPKCISNLSALASQAISNATITYIYDEIYRDIMWRSATYDDSATLMWKGKMSKYRSTLGLLRSIDFSSNRLIGEIPNELMSLVGLVSLNISRNMLSGEIPPTIGQLKSLDFLDLSRNHLSGRIPPQLSQLDRVSVLDLSYNDLSGEIPHGTQLQGRDASAYVGNPKLCGPPLNETCPIHGQQIDGNDVYDEQFFTEGFYIAMAIGFIVGFWGVCCSLILKKSWRYAYFKFLSDVYDKLYVLAAINIAKLQRIRS